jgi:predicted RNase H-like nuclease (RuvC/YqgF family)
VKVPVSAMQEVSAHKAAKKEVAQLKKALEEAAHFKEDIQRLEKQLATLRNENSAMKASVAGAKRSCVDSRESSLAQPQAGSKASNGTERAQQGGGSSDGATAALQKRVQQQAMELKSLARILAEKEQLLDDFRRHGCGPGASQVNAKECARVVVCFVPLAQVSASKAAAEF